MLIITITGSDTTDGSLDLSDHGNSKAKQGEDVQWHIAVDSGVDSIKEIGMKPPPNTNIFSDPPRQVGSSKNWKGTVSDSAAPGSEYIYFIKWIADDGSGEHTFDPKIIVNTR